MFGCLYKAQPGPRGNETCCLVGCIHCWACIARNLKHLWVWLAGNAQIGSFLRARPRRAQASEPLHEWRREGCEVITCGLLQPPVSFSLISFLPCSSDLHNGASIRGKLYTKKMHLDATVPFRRLVCSFVGRKFFISCFRLELFWTNFVRFVAHDQSLEISSLLEQQSSALTPPCLISP